MWRLCTALLLVVMPGLIACDAPPATPLAATPTPPPTAVQTAVPTLTPDPTPEQPRITNLTVWWPDRLAPADSEAVQTIIDAQLADFQAAFGNITVEFRRKRSQDIGGVMATLRSANLVAPGALPDITLIRREDLAEVVQNRLAQPLEGRITSGILADLYDPALALGWVREELYGLPYLMDVQLLAYDRSEVAITNHPTIWTFDAVLSNRLRFVFPAVRASGVSEVFYLQYLSAGGRPPVDGVLTLDEDALRTVLKFYEEAREAGLIDERVLEYTTTADYQDDLRTGEFDAAVINASVLRGLLADEALGVGLIPTADGVPRTIINGWVWVVIAQDNEHQQAAARLLNWLMASSRQAEYAQVVGFLPTQRSALRAQDFGLLTTEQVDELVGRTVVPLSSEYNLAARAMHSAFVAVITGASTAEAAARDAIEQVSG